MNRFQILAAQNEQVFHSDDLARLWGISNKQTLNVTIHRYTNQKLLYKIHRGFYSLRPVNELDPLLLGCKEIHGYVYASTETVLVRAGILLQSMPVITMVSEKSRKFTIAAQAYSSRQLKDEHLFNSAGIQEHGPVKIASVERAVSDLLYFDRHYHFDNHNAINWQQVIALQKEIGYSSTPGRYP
jgi:predicted transcriptional regulator of viral defense system